MCLGTQHILICGVALESQKKRELGLSTDRYFFASRALGWASSPFFAIIFLNIVDLFAGHALNRNFDLRVQSCSIKENSRSQNQRMQKVTPKRSASLFTRCTRANAFPDLCRQDSADF